MKLSELCRGFVTRLVLSKQDPLESFAPNKRRNTTSNNKSLSNLCPKDSTGLTLTEKGKRMKTYEVELRRVSYITLTVEAENEDDAEEKAWAEIGRAHV